MYNVSAAYKDWILTNPATRTFAIRASIVTPSGTVNLTDADFVMGGLDIVETLASGDTIEIGMATMSELTMTVYNTHAEYDTMQMRGSRVFVEIGYTLEDTSIEWVPMGRYIVTESSIPDSTITLKCSDYMLLFERPWTDAILSYPATIGEIVAAACLACGVTSVDTTGIPNIDYSVTYDFLTWSNVTCRNVLAYCAQICGRNARMTRNGLLELVWYGDMRQLSDAVSIDGNTDTADGGDGTATNEKFYDAGYIGQAAPDYTLGPTHYERFLRDSGAVILSGLSYTNDGDTYTVGGDRYALQLDPNPLLQENVETALLTLWDAIGFFAYTPYTAVVFGDPARQAGDRVTITDRDGVSYHTIATRVTHRFRGRQEIRAVGRSQEMSDYSSATAKALTQLLIQQRKETVRLTAYEQAMVQLGELVAHSMGVYNTAEVQPDGSTIYYQHDAATLAASTYIWKQTATTFTVSDDGGVSWHGMDAAGNILTRVLTAIKINADLITTGALNADLITTGTLAAARIASASITGDKLDVDSVVASKLTADEDLSTYLVAAHPASNWAMLRAYDADYSAEDPVWAMYGDGGDEYISILIAAQQAFYSSFGNGNFFAGNDQFSVYRQISGSDISWGVGLSGAGISRVGTGLYDYTSVEIAYGSNQLGVDATGAYKRIGGVKTYL